MTARADLIEHLLDDVALSALIGTRLYPGKWPQKVVLPYVVLFEIGGRPGQAIQGTVVIKRPVLRFICYADTYGGALEVGEALTNAIVSSGFAVFFEDERSDVNAMTGVHRRDIDVRVSYAA